MYKFENMRDAYEVSRKYARGREVVPFPPYVTIELTNRCNFKCVMCQVSYLKAGKTELDFSLFRKAVDEIAKYGSVVRFLGFEEPFLYSRIWEAIEYVKNKDLLLHITTNGSLLDRESILKVIGSGLDSIIFSFQGFTEKEYCLMRNVPGKTYAQLIDSIELLYKLRKDKKPHIKITTTISERDDIGDKEGFMKAHIGHADEVQVTGITHFAHIDEYFHRKGLWDEFKLNKPEKLKEPDCYSVNYEMLVDEDGGVYPCCAFFTKELCLGSVKEGSLFTIWNSEQAQAIRKKIYDREFDKIPDCSVCAIRYKYGDVRSVKYDR